MNYKQKSEVGKIIKARVKNIVEERIIPELDDELNEWMCELAGDLTHVDATQEDVLDDSMELFYSALLVETRDQLTKILSKREK